MGAKRTTVMKRPDRSCWLRLLSVLFVASGLSLLGGLAIAGSAATSLAAPEVRRLDSDGRVEVTAQVVASDDEAPSHARSRAMGLARQAAVEFVAGVRIKSGSLSFSEVRESHAASLMQVLTSVRADALMVEEKLLQSRTSPLVSGGYRMEVVMRGRVLDRTRSAKSDFQAEVELPDTLFRDGEEVRLKLRANRDARIYVIGMSDAGAVLLLPNAHMQDTRVRAGRWLEFPDEGLQERGVKLIAQVAEGKRVSREALLVLALRGRRTLDSVRPRSGDDFRVAEANAAGALLADLLEPLLEIPADDWSFDQVIYEVVKR